MPRIGEIIRNNQAVCCLALPFYYVNNFFSHNPYTSDDAYLKKLYLKKMKKPLNLSNPTSFNEKLQWLKLNDRTKEHCRYADKLQLKSIVNEELGVNYTPKTYFVTKNPSDICLNKFLEYPSVIKTNHDQGTVFIVDQPSERTLARIRNELRIALTNNLYWRYREWQYKNIDKLIYIEEYIGAGTATLDEFKFHIAHGECILILHNHKVHGTKFYNWYTPDWTNLQISKPNQPQGEITSKPDSLLEMIEIAKKIASRFIFARVDIYQADNRIIIGEVTFHPAAGLKPFIPESFDIELGKQIDLNLL